MDYALRTRTNSAYKVCSHRRSSRARCRNGVTATLLTDPPTTSGRGANSSAPPGERRTAGEYACPRPNPVAQDRFQSPRPVTLAMLNDVRTMFNSLLHEYAYWVDEAWVTGTIPPELHGTYYRNGPGLHVANPRYRRHTLDGDGMVFSLGFSGGRAYFRNRYVRTKGFLEEQAAGRPLLRNSFTRGAVDGSLSFNPFDLRFKNVANTNVLPWAGKLYALWEAGLPHLMDPATLDTLRESRMGGQIRTDTFAAHYRVVHEQQQQQPAAAAGPAGDGPMGQSTSSFTRSSRRLVAFSNEFSFTGGRAVFYEFDEGGRLLHESEHALPGIDIALIHDMLVTEHWYVLVVGPIRLQPTKFATQYVWGGCSIAECLVFDEKQPTRVMLFPRPGRPSGKVLSPRVLTADPFFVFHNVNGWEAEGGQLLVLDTVAWDRVSFEMELFDKDMKRLDGFVGGARTQLTRLTCDLRTGRVERRKLLQRTVEFPAIDPRVVGRPHRVAWFVGDAVNDPVHWAPPQAVMRVELDPTLSLFPSAASTIAPNHQPPLQPPCTAPGAVHGADAGAVPGVAVDAWYLPDRSFPGEPMFVPRPGSNREGEGWLLMGAHNAATERAEVLIFDAESLSSGPLATIHLPHRLPVSLHGAWDATYRGPDPGDESVPRWQELGSVRAL
ncbi:hypothetical protein Agub_g8073 [Astrephomene gubernaculifera]|uniref:Carotenoid oxygenase n=1 Tax=Astrephomene gubernaculifera TaxID=47775 RepID=A0AAD3DR32_9CHLO|nr:hypothetical protein Agub_g8073 [Astrephomene gubernaculifera]